MFPIGDDEDWKITPTDQNESGIFLFVLDDLSNFDGYWLCQNQQIFNPAGYGDITFGADDDVPVPPENIWVSTIFYNDETLAEINCTQPPINDFYHFKVYLNNGSECQVFELTSGTQLFYFSSPFTTTQVYVTIVDKASQETETSEIVNFDPWVEMEEPVMKAGLNIYHNPATNNATISFSLDETLPTQVMVFDIHGKLVSILINFEIPAGDCAVVCNACNESGEKLKPGIYFIEITTPKTSVSQKLILTR